MKSVKKFVCIHGHFYQPPRENAWLEKVEFQESAYPFHDWNERISDECYTPNAASRILDDKGVIKDIVNNYARISFNFGPTLLSWLEEKEPETYQSILDADKKSGEYYDGHGSAMAQAYNHLIMPLANARDLHTQVVWGIKDFEERFGRAPEGMWLPETAVDTNTLEALVAHGITFTVLAPRQASRVREIGSDKWINVSGEKIDPRRAYLCNLPSGKSIALFFYDGLISKEVAFNKLLDNGRLFADKLVSTLDFSSDEPQLCHIATDGESYGHHHRYGDMALASCVDSINSNDQVQTTNYAAFLKKFPPKHEVEIIENSSWSCVHGVERWRSNCGCHTGGEESWNQKWREPLRYALDWLRSELEMLYEKEGESLFKDPWNARDAYIDVILDRSAKNVEKFLDLHGSGIKKAADRAKALRMLEMQRNAMLMYTSCGWFFNDVSGIETQQILQYASRAIQLASQVAGRELEENFIKKLAESKSNISDQEDASKVYKDHVLPARLDLMRVGMHYAAASLFSSNPDTLHVFNYSTSSEFFEMREAGIQKMGFGRIQVKSNTTYSEKQFSFVALYMGQHNLIGYISVDMDAATFKEMYESSLKAFRESNIAKIMEIIQDYFHDNRFSIWQLFKDEKREIFEMILEQSLKKVDEELDQIYDQNYQLVNALSAEEYPIPKIYLQTIEYVLNKELKDCLQAHPLNVHQLKTILYKFDKWNLSLSDQIPYERIVNQLINRNLMEMYVGANGHEQLESLNQGFKMMRPFKLNLDLHESQNLYFKIAKSKEFGRWERGWKKQFELLGKNLGIKVAKD